MGFSPELSNGLDYGELSAPVCVQNMFVDEACKEYSCLDKQIASFISS